MAKKSVLITDPPTPSTDIERGLVEAAGFTLAVAQCRTAAEVLAAAAEADGLLVNMAPITAAVVAGLPRCRVIVRYGVGVDNVDLAAARARGIAVCNIPGFCTDEVADHAAALALALARRLPALDRALRAGAWTAPRSEPMPPLQGATFAVAGLGRIGRAVLDRVRPFGCRLAAYDPLVPDAAFAAAGAARLDADALFREADVLSLHLPLTPETRHFANAARLAAMKPRAVLVNTSRGGLVDTAALAAALRAGRPAAAGIDVFETEPLPPDHPLRGCDNALLTPHIAWYSGASLPRLQRLAAEEVVRGIRGEKLQSCVNA
jgi:D-3-phosphoglycerate dehydrogenase